MRNHLDLWSLKVDDNTIALTLFISMPMCEKFPEQSSQVADWHGEWLNRQKTRMPRGGLSFRETQQVPGFERHSDAFF